jgi:hypothetical protein
MHRTIAQAKKIRREELPVNLGSAEAKKENLAHCNSNSYWQRKDVIKVNCMKNEGGKVVTDNEETNYGKICSIC